MNIPNPRSVDVLVPLFALACNWQHKVFAAGEVPQVESNIDFAGAAVTVFLLVQVLLLRTSIGTCRTDSLKVYPTCNPKPFSVLYTILFLPILLNITSGATRYLSNGDKTFEVWSYGSDSSVNLLLSGLALVLCYRLFWLRVRSQSSN